MGGGGENATNFDSIMPADDELMQVMELTKNSSVSPPAQKKLRTN